MASDWVDISKDELWEDIPEEEVYKPQMRGRAAEIGVALGRGFLGLGEAAVGGAQKFSPLFSKYIGVLPRLGVTKPTEMLGTVKERIAAAHKKIPATREGLEGWALNVLGKGAPYLGATIGTGGTSLGLYGSALIGFTMGGEAAYGKAKAGGASEKQAMIEYGLGGIAEAALEMWGVSKLLKFKEAGKGSLKLFAKNIKGKLWKKALGNLKNVTGDMLKSAIVEGLEEATQEGAAIVIPGILRNDWPRKADGTVDWESMLSQMGEAGAGGALIGGIVPGVMNIPGGISEFARPAPMNIKRVARRIQESDISPHQKARMIESLQKFEGAENAKLEIPESIQHTLDVADRIAEEMAEVQSRRPEIAKHLKQKRAEQLQEQLNIIESLQDEDPIQAVKIARSSTKGFIRDLIPEVSEKFSQDDIRTMYQSINESKALTMDEKAHVHDFLKATFEDKVVPSRSRMRAFDAFFGTNIMEGVKALNVPFSKKAWRSTIDVLNVEKAIKASVDLSALLRQAWLFSFSHPIKALPVAWRGAKMFANEAYYNLREMERRTHPLFELSKKLGIQYTEIGGGRLKAEELFYSETAHKIPGMGKLIKASDRAFTGMLNDIRLEAFAYYHEQLGGSEASMTALEEAAAFVNHSTGRGTGKPGGKLERWGPELSVAFWTPKLTIGRVQTVTDLVTKPHIRKLIAHELLKAFGGAALTATLLALGLGAKVGFNPISSDFLKIVKGRTRIDVGGGYSQLLRFVAQLILRERKSTETGRISHVDLVHTLTRFLRSKISPPVGHVWDIIGGYTFEGKKVRPEADFLDNYLQESVTPLFIQDVIDAIHFQGWSTGVMVAPLAVFGLGASTYEITGRGEAMRLKNHYAHQIFGKDWDQLGNDMQDAIREWHPEIIKQEGLAKREQESYAFLGEMLEEQKEAGRRVLKSLPKDVQNEIEKVGADIKGLNRHLRSDWFLNQERFKQYENDAKAILNKVLPKIVSASGWNRLTEEIQQAILQQIIDDCKKYVREKIVAEANIDDLMQLRR